MDKAHERRLVALERESQAAGQDRAEYDRLLALVRAGQLTEGDLPRLSDQQLWWLVAGACIPMPPAAELERLLAEVLSHAQS